MTGGGEARSRLNLGFAIAFAVVCSLATIPSKARAQSLFDRDANVGVLDRPHPEYQALGLRVGSFLFYPKVTLQTNYNDNIYALPTNVSGDFIFNVDPQIAIQSDWNRNSLSLSAGSTVSLYAAHPTEDSVQYNVSGDGRLDIERFLSVDLTAGYSMNTLPRSATDYTQLTINPLQYGEASVQVNVNKEFNRFKISGSVSDVTDSYSNGVVQGGGVLNEQFLNHDLVSGSLRLQYAISPDVAVFGSELITDYIYTDSSSRNSTGTNTLFGVNFQLTHLITAELGAGYITSAYVDPAVKNFGGASGRAQIKWFATQLLTVSVTADEGLFDSGISESPAYVAQDVALEADYELLRNLIIVGGINGSWAEFRGISRNDDTYGASVTANYLINRTVGIAVRLSHSDRHSFGVDRVPGYSDDTVGLALTLQR